jgi:uncharacterized protein YndB with AHSA1/START domain
MRKLVFIIMIAAPLFAADSARRIDREVTVHASRGEVWKAWTTVEGARFFSPAANIELRPGGAYEMYFDPQAPEGKKGGEGNRIIAFEPERMLLFSWNAPTKFGPLREERTYVLLQLDDAGEGRTRVRLTHFGWREGKDWDAVYGYFGGAWTWVLGQLETKYP